MAEMRRQIAEKQNSRQLFKIRTLGDDGEAFARGKSISRLAACDGEPPLLLLLIAQRASGEVALVPFVEADLDISNCNITPFLIRLAIY